MNYRLLHNASLAEYTTWKVGGPAHCLYCPTDQAELKAFLAQLPPAEPLLWLGYGSNMLVRDGGFPGTVILIKGTLDKMEYNDPNGIYAQAGVSCAKLARFVTGAGLTGAEFLAGIPGTLGGALALNAGACGGETWSLVQKVTTIDRNGEVRERNPSDYQVSYREVHGPDGEWFLGAQLVFIPGSIETSQLRMRKCLEQRNATQPMGLPSAGSTFRNPPGDYAGRLIEAAGLKGLRYGGAEVSTKHANFIVNIGEATSADIEALMELVTEKVKQNCGIQLVPEVKIVGDHK